MWLLGLSVVAVLVIYSFHWIIIFMLNNPKFSNRSSLPPGSMGFPLIGETLQLMIPSYSLELHPFITKRIQRFGPIFRTSVFGQPTVVSADPEFNDYLFQQEGKLVEMWLGPLSKVFLPKDGDAKLLGIGYMHKYIRSITLSHVGPDSIREKLLPQFEDMFRDTFHNWSTLESIEVKQSSAIMIFRFFAKHFFGYDAEKLPENERMAELLFTNFSDGLLAIPLNIPGTSYHKCLKEGKKAFKLIKDILEERRKSPEKYRGDFIDQAINDKMNEKIMTDDQIVYVVSGLMAATWLTNSTLLALLFNFFAEHPSVIEELRIEHEGILKSRDESSSSLTWNEYKSMKFTQQVINEALRFTISIPGFLRTALKDIHVKEYTIPAGWFVLVVPMSHMNSEIYKDPLTFNPWRWKDLDSYTVSKNFKPFGGGSRQCPGAELSRAFISTFLHVMVTKYRWTKIKGGRVVRNPMLGFGDGVHIKIWEKNN